MATATTVAYPLPTKRTFITDGLENLANEGLSPYDVLGEEWDVQHHAQQSYAQYLREGGKQEEVHEMANIVAEHLTERGAEEGQYIYVRLPHLRDEVPMTLHGKLLYRFSGKHALFVLADVDTLENVYLQIIANKL